MIEIHEAANIFPMHEHTIPQLAEDIKRFGQRETIKLLRGKLLDGRRRLKACELAGVKPLFETVETDDPVGLSVALNLTGRRHLSTSEAAMCAARAGKLKEKFQEEAKERMRRGGRMAGGGRPSRQGPDNCPDPARGDSRDKLGDEFGVSGKSVERAGKVLANGIPELVTATDRGEISVNKAEYISKHSPELQGELLAAELREEQKSQRTVKPKPAEKKPEGELRGKGVFYANNAINWLTRIPKNDPLRQEGLKAVTDWVRRNK